MIKPAYMAPYALVALGVLTLAGCGAANLARPVSVEGASSGSRLSMPASALGAKAGPLNVQAMLAAVRKTTDGLQGFSATVKTFDSGPTGTDNQTLKVAFKKPHQLRVTVEQSSGQGQGVQVLYTGGEQLKVHPTFPPVTVSLALTDDRLKSKNGWTLKDTGVEAIQTVLLDPASQIKPLGNSTMNGKSMALVEVRSATSPHGVTKEIIGVDREYNLPTYREIYMGDKVVYRLTIQNMKLTAPSSSEMNL